MTVFISLVQNDDEPAFLSAVSRSHALFEDWVDPPSDSEGFAKHLTNYSADNNFQLLGSR